MFSRNGILLVVALVSMGIVCHAAIGAKSDDGAAANHMLAVNANGDDALLPDFDGDGTIGFGDFVIFAGVFGARQGDEKYEAKYDLNGDGEIGFSDFVIFAQNFGKEAPSPVVAIPDPNLRTAIESALNKDSGAPITQAEMATLDSLEASDADISDLAGLEYATNLTWLDLASNDITSVSVLEGLTNLAHLILSGNNVTDLAGLVANTGLGTGDTVDLADNPLNAASQSTHIPALRKRGVSVSFVPSPAVAIPDPNLRAAIAAALGKERAAPITHAEIKTLNRLEANDSGISDLTGLEFATNLSYLNLSSWPSDDLPDNNISDVSPLTGLTSLTRLWLSNNSIEDISALSKLTDLERLGLQENSISDISALSSMTKLHLLKLGYNNRTLFDSNLIPTRENSGITDISPLAALTNLTSLELQYNSISDISPLSELTRLGHLILQVNPISDVSALLELTRLRNLVFGANKISDISALSGLSNLRWLILGANNIADLSSLSGLINLESLNLNRNDISDISALSGMTNLESLVFGQNNITDISPLAGLTNLRRLVLENNSIEDILALSGLTNLEELDLSSNKVTDIFPLRGLTNLEKLSLRFNKVTDISPLWGLTSLAVVQLRWNPLNDSAFNDHIPALQSRGVTVIFTPLYRKGDFDIELVFLDSFTEDQKHALRLVALRWMSVIAEDLPDYEFTQGWSGGCGDHTYEITAGERIDDLRIYMTTFGEDAHPTAVGWGGPSLLRDETHLPVLGCMGFYLERANLLTTGLHEIGHVLGFVSRVWEEFGFYQNPPDGDTHFNGPLATAAFDNAGGREYKSAKVPLQKVGSHWRGEVFERGELMLPWGGGQLSAITVQSLADLGYGVDVTQADAYTLPGATAGKTAAKIAISRSSVSLPGLNVARAINSPSSDAELYGQGRVPDGPSSILGDARRTGRLESAERFWGRGMNFDLADNQRMWGTGSPAHAEPELTCGAGLMNEPIYVVDPQGRVVRTIHR